MNMTVERDTTLYKAWIYEANTVLADEGMIGEVVLMFLMCLI